MVSSTKEDGVEYELPPLRGSLTTIINSFKVELRQGYVEFAYQLQRVVIDAFALVRGRSKEIKDYLNRGNMDEDEPPNYEAPQSLEPRVQGLSSLLDDMSLQLLQAYRTISQMNPQGGICNRGQVSKNAQRPQWGNRGSSRGRGKG